MPPCLPKPLGPQEAAARAMQSTQCRNYLEARVRPARCCAALPEQVDIQHPAPRTVRMAHKTDLGARPEELHRLQDTSSKHALSNDMLAAFSHADSLR